MGSCTALADDRIMLPLAFSGIFAVNAVATLSRDAAHLAAINEVADRHQLPRDLTGDDQMPHLRRPTLSNPVPPSTQPPNA